MRWRTPVTQQAWKQEHQPTLHGWVSGLDNGIIRALISLTPEHWIAPICQCTDVVD